MLILSRRESEKVLFPTLGITIEVSRIKGKTVRLGIDAPKEIRIIRGELEDTAGWNDKPKSNRRPYQSNHDEAGELDPSQGIRKCLDAANLAIHLAQNQLRQQLNENAEFALEQAIECMKNLEEAVGLAASTPSTPVREARSRYKTATKKIAICVDFDQASAAAVGSQLKEFGYVPVLIDSGKSLIEFLMHREQPNLILTMRDRLSTEHIDDPIEPGSDLRMFGVGSLQKFKRTVNFADFEITSWVSDESDSRFVEECFP